MPKKCCIPYCKIEQDDEIGRHESFFKIPNDENKKKTWYHSISKVFKINYNKYSYVCSLHFEEGCFSYTESNARRIKKESHPTIFADFKSRKLQNTVEDEDVINEHKVNDQNISISSPKQIPEDIDHNEHILIENEEMILLKQNTKYDTSENTSSPTLKITENAPINNEGNRCIIDYLQTDEDFKKSISVIDPYSIAFTPENLPKIKKLFFKVHKEITDLRKRMKRSRTKIYRYKKRVNNVNLLLLDLKKQYSFKENI